MNDLTTFEFGNKDSNIILIQPIDDYNQIGNEYKLIKQMVTKDFRLIAVKINDWNKELSPWKAPAVFGKEVFAGGASTTLEKIERIIEKIRNNILGDILWLVYLACGPRIKQISF